MSVFSDEFSFNEVVIRASRPTSAYGYPISIQLLDRSYSQGTLHLHLKDAVSLAQQLTAALGQLETRDTN